MKKTFLFLLMAAMLLSVTAVWTAAGRGNEAVVPMASVISYVKHEPETEYTSGDGYSYILLPDGSAAITRYTAEIPETVDGIAVTALAGNAGMCSKDTTLAIPSFIRTCIGNPFILNEGTIELEPNHPYLSIHDNALFEIASNTLIVYLANRDESPYSIPEGTVRIGDYAFCQTRLSGIHIPDSVTELGDCSLYSYNLTEITIPNSVRIVGKEPLPSHIEQIHVAEDHPTLSVINGSLIEKETGRLIAFESATEDSRYEIPYGVTEIGSNVFYQCPNQKEIVVPDSVRIIDESAFYFCYATVYLPDSVTYIGSSAFARCNNTEITLPANLTYLGEGAFFQCYDLKRVTIPGSLHVLEAHTFSSCTDLEEIIIEDGVNSICQGALGYGQALKSVVIPASVTDIYPNILPEETAPQVTFTVVPGSYAESYCQAYGYNYIYAE